MTSPLTQPVSAPPSDLTWYKDAIIYECHVRAFMDSSLDGIGDFQGLISKLDYLKDLGITALWLLPFYPSPGRDDGYDIADYMDVNPAYGKLRDVRMLVREAHERGLRVITELGCNHTSDQHPCFQRARRARPGSAARSICGRSVPHAPAKTARAWRQLERWTGELWSGSAEPRREQAAPARALAGGFASDDDSTGV